MPRRFTFSLTHLLLAVTSICILCAVAVSAPENAIIFALNFLLLAPTGLVCLTLVSFSRNRQLVLTWKANYKGQALLLWLRGRPRGRRVPHVR